MKKIFTLFAVMGIISSSFAQWYNGGRRGPEFDNHNDNFRSSALVINAFTEKPFTIMVDNMQYQLNADYGRRHDNTINLASLCAGKHTVTIYETRGGFFGCQKQEEVYCASMFLKPGVETSLNINGYCQVNVAERQLYNGNGYGHNDNRWGDRRDDRGDDRGDDRRDDRGDDRRDGGYH